MLAVLAALAVGIGVLTLTVGDLAPSLGQVVAFMAGRGDGSADFVIGKLRLPRLVMAALCGTGLALSGALFQSLLRNPLASPDVIGITGGASVAAVFALLILGLDGPAVAVFAFAGAIGVAVLSYVIAWRRGVQGYRFILAGIGFAFLASSVLGYLLTRSRVDAAQDALVWLVGSLGSTTWRDVSWLAASLAVLVPFALVLARPLRMLELGDDLAAALGVRAERSRRLLLVVAVALAAVATAAAGPIAFVALVSAPIARRIVGSGSLALLPSALVGTLIVSSGDLLGQHAFAGIALPVGVITGVVGGLYLLWLLSVSSRRGTVS